MCNLYSITRNQEAIRRLFQVTRDLTDNLPALPAVYPDTMAPVVRVSPDSVLTRSESALRVQSVVAKAVNMMRFFCCSRGLISALFLSFLPFSFIEAASPPPGTLPMYCLNGGTALYMPTDLDQLRTNPSGKFCLGHGINLTGINWVPIGSFSSPFTGDLDGKSCSDPSKPETCSAHTIKNLTISASSSSNAFVSYGLFAYILGARIENIGVLNANIAVMYTGTQIVAVGGLVGDIIPLSTSTINSTINNSYVTGIINVQATVGSVGGLVGNGGFYVIQHSFSAAAVSASNSLPGANSAIGGIVGGLGGCTPLVPSKSHSRMPPDR
jgi:hypothetical protein